MSELNVERTSWAVELEPCGTDPMTGFFRDGCCRTGPEDRGQPHDLRGRHRGVPRPPARIGNDLARRCRSTPSPAWCPGDRWCVTALNWARAHRDGAAAPVVLASTNAAVLEFVPLEALREHAVDVPEDLSGLD